MVGQTTEFSAQISGCRKILKNLNFSLDKRGCLVYYSQAAFEEPLVTYAPLAQLVEHLTLNQGVQGSSPWRCTKHGPLVKWPKTPASHAGNSGSNPLRVTTATL